MGTKQKIFVYAFMSAFFIYVYLTIPIAEYRNANTEPEFVTIGDTVEIKLPLIEEGGRWKKLQRAESVPLVIDSDSIFWDDAILDVKYSIFVQKHTGRQAVIDYGTGRGTSLGSRNYRIEDDKPGGKRLIKLVVPDDARLTGHSLVWNLWFVDDLQPHKISLIISGEEQRGTYIFYKALRIVVLVLAIMSFAMLLGVTIGRSPATGLLSRRLRSKRRSDWPY